jgi:hypothetical protein
LPAWCVRRRRRRVRHRHRVRLTALERGVGEFHSMKRCKLIAEMSFQSIAVADIVAATILEPFAFTNPFLL